MSFGVVTPATPSFTAPSGMVIWIGVPCAASAALSRSVRAKYSSNNAIRLS